MTFLPKETINDPASLDAIMVEMYKAYEEEKVPMSEEQSSDSIHVMMASNNDIDDMYDNFIKKSYQVAGFFKRCEMFPIKYEKRLQIWLTVMNHQFGIGGMILIAYFVQWAAYRKLKAEWALSGGVDEMTKEVDLGFVCEQVFPFGVFAKSTVHEFWDKQKVDASPDNLIDHPTACISFMPIERTEPITYKDH